MKKITLFLFMSLIVSTMVAQSPSLMFNGTDNAIEWSESDGILVTSENHTWEMWVKGTATTIGVIYTEGWGGSSYRGQFRIHADGAGKVKIEFRNYQGTYLIPKKSTSTSTVFDNNWHHIAVVGTTTGGTTATKLYVDGVVDATDFGTYTRPTSWNSVKETRDVETNGGALNNSVIGQIARATERIDNTAKGGNSYTWYNGEIDEFRAWKRALEVSEIAANTCTPVNKTDLHRHVRFNEGTGTDFNDEVESTNATLLGTTTGATYTTNGSCAPLSLKDNMLSNGISIFPNPVSSVLEINIINANTIVKTVSLLDLSGKVIYTVNNSNPINVSKFSKGLYVLKIESQEGAISSKKVIIN